MVRLVDLKLIRTLQVRAKKDKKKVCAYSERMRAGDKFPSLVAFTDGVHLWLADGFHRHAAALLADMTEFLVVVYRGTIGDALCYALGANRNHGMPMNNADKRRAVHLALTRIGHESDHSIAERIGVSQPFVSKIRTELKTVITSDKTLRSAGTARDKPVSSPNTRDSRLYQPQIVSSDGFVRKAFLLISQIPPSQVVKFLSRIMSSNLPMLFDDKETMDRFHQEFASYLAKSSTFQDHSPSMVAESNPSVDANDNQTQQNVGTPEHHENLSTSESSMSRDPESSQLDATPMGNANDVAIYNLAADSGARPSPNHAARELWANCRTQIAQMLNSYTPIVEILSKLEATKSNLMEMMDNGLERETVLGSWMETYDKYYLADSVGNFLLDRDQDALPGLLDLIVASSAEKLARLRSCLDQGEVSRKDLPAVVMEHLLPVAEAETASIL